MADMADMDGLNPNPHTAQQELKNAAYAHALGFARDHYARKTHIVEIVEKTEASNQSADGRASPPIIWHALIALGDGRHAVVGVRYNNDGPSDGDRWSAFEVGAPTLGDVRDS